MGPCVLLEVEERVSRDPLEVRDPALNGHADEEHGGRRAEFVVQALGLPTLYHEVEAVDYERDEVVLANTGEHDLRLAPQTPVRLAPDAWYTGDPIVSPCAQFSIAASPASLVGFVPVDGMRWVVADGDGEHRSATTTGVSLLIVD